MRDNPYFLYKVTKVYLFGSYLPEAERINDIDLAVKLEPREKDSRETKAAGKATDLRVFQAGAAVQEHV